MGSTNGSTSSPRRHRRLPLLIAAIAVVAFLRERQFAKNRSALHP
ncbi:MAG TPA: hypothetical protein PLP95_06700 [Microthrixaceae bacterium]|nr:hypothetical protein [Microthrixaceae bacterium]